MHPVYYFCIVKSIEILLWLYPILGYFYLGVTLFCVAHIIS